MELAVGYVIENLRLAELIRVVGMNRGFYDDFIAYLDGIGYGSIHEFVQERDKRAGRDAILGYLRRAPLATLHDGCGRAYPRSRAVWLLLGWLFRDAPTQRLEPLVDQAAGKDKTEKRASLLNQVRMFVAPLFPRAESWTWEPFSEVMLARLEGSRRASRGTQIETLVRGILRTIFTENGLELKVGEGTLRIANETYDVYVRGHRGQILLPVKSRETMGGGHARLFTRDISESISVAHDSKYLCVPIIIAESWKGDLKALGCTAFICISENPNQTEKIAAALDAALRKLVHVFQKIA